MAFYFLIPIYVGELKGNNILLGLISEEEIIEVKCLYKIASSGKNLRKAVEKKEVACLCIDENNKMRLKETHDYYYQVPTKSP